MYFSSFNSKRLFQNMWELKVRMILALVILQHLHRFRNSQSEFSKTWGGASWWWGGQWSVGCGFSSLSSSSSSSLGVTWSDIRCQDQLASSENQSPKPVECLESKIRQCESWKKMKKLVCCEMWVYSHSNATNVFFSEIIPLISSNTHFMLSLLWVLMCFLTSPGSIKVFWQT